MTPIPPEFVTALLSARSLVYETPAPPLPNADQSSTRGTAPALHGTPNQTGSRRVRGKRAERGSDSELQAFLTPIVERAAQAGQLTAAWLTLYHAAFDRLGVGAAGMADYLQFERAILADIVWEARKPGPSHMQLARLVLRLALDARRDCGCDTDELVIGQDGLPVMYRHSHPGLRYLGPPPVDRRVRTLTPPAIETVVAFLGGTTPYHALADRVETLFGRVVTEDDTTARTFGKVVEFEQVGREVRVWVRGHEVCVTTAEARALLRHFCLHPQGSATGAALKQRYRAIKNQTRAAEAVQEALAQAEPSAAEWFCKNPLRWAADVRVVRRI